LAVYIKTVQEVQAGIAGRFKARRLAMNLTQNELAARSGVTFSTGLASESGLGTQLPRRFRHAGYGKPGQLSHSIARRPAGHAGAAEESDGQERTQPWHIVRQSC